MVRGTSFPLNAPVENIDEIWNEAERNAVLQMLQYSFIGSSETVREQIQSFVDSTGVDELMVVSNIFDHTARLRSYEIISQFKKEKHLSKNTEEINNLSR